MNPTRDTCVKKNLELLLDAFEHFDLDSTLSDASNLDYSSISHTLFQASEKAEDNASEPLSKMLRLLAQACWMRLSPQDRNAPFSPTFIGDGKRSMIPDDFDDSEIGFFAEIVESIDNSFVKARIADLVWNSRQHRRIDFAIAAIDSYTQIPLNADSWFHDGELCWRRAIALNRTIQKADRLDHIESSLIEALMSATGQREYYGYLLADTLKSGGIAKNHSRKVAEKLESIAQELGAAGNFRASGDYYSASSKWFGFSGDDAKSVDMTVAEAEAFVNDSTSKISSDSSNHGVAAGLLKNAVNVYVKIPRADRERHDVDQRIRELRIRIREHEKLAQDEFATYSGPAIDVNETIEQAREHVRGMPQFEALMAFANIHRIDVGELRKSAIETLSRFPFRTLFPTVFKSHDGRTVRNVPGYRSSGTDEENELAIRAEMIRLHYEPLLSIIVQALIQPVLAELTLEHRLREVDFVEISSRSPFVPIGREVLFGKGLFYGFNLDFASSIHLLAPQIENVVRSHLNARGVVTTHLDRNGIETEHGLSTLMNFTETKDIFGEDLTFEFTALFCDQLGSNLRNNIAHGLLDDLHCYTASSIYAWWLCFKLVMNSYCDSRILQVAEEEVCQNDGSPQEESDQ